MAKSEDKKSDTEEALDKIKVGAKLAALGGLSVLTVAAKAVSVGADTVQKSAKKARNGLLK